MHLPADFLARTGRWALGGVPEGQDARLAAQLAGQLRRGLIFVCRDDTRMAALEQAIRFFSPATTVLSLPAWDCQPYDRVSPNGEIAARRMDCLTRLASARPTENWLLLVTVNAVLQRLPPAAYLKDNAFAIRRGGQLTPDALIKYLAGNGFARVGTVMEPGEFAVRGGLVDLFPPGSEQPYRVDFFGDAVESIRQFDPADQRSRSETEVVALTPMSEVPLDADSVNRFREGDG